MEKYKKQIGIGIIIIIIWHIFIALNEKIQVSGLFSSKPENGYAWEGTTNRGSRFFWLNTDVEWQEGLTHSEYKAISSADEGIWNPLPGYRFVDKTSDFKTIWQQGLLHPDFKAFSDYEEGLWQPAAGYKFLYEGETFSDTVWEPEKRYDQLKVTTLREQDNFIPFPGYQFVDKVNSLKVIWVPGTVNYDNPKLIAGAREGTWDVNYRPTVHYASRLDYRKVIVGLIAVGAVASMIR